MATPKVPLCAYHPKLGTGVYTMITDFQADETTFFVPFRAQPNKLAVIALALKANPGVQTIKVTDRVSTSRQVIYRRIRRDLWTDKEIP